MTAWRYHRSQSWICLFPSLEETCSLYIEIDVSEGITRVLKVLREFDALHIGNLLFQAVSIHIKMSNDLCMIMYVHMVLF